MRKQNSNNLTNKESEMGKKEKLAKIHKTASIMSLENNALLDNLISNSDTDGCPPRCGTLLEMLKKRNKEIFYKIEKSRQILNITD